MQCITNGRAVVASHRANLAADERACSASALDPTLSIVLAGALGGTGAGHELANSAHGSTNALLALMSARSSFLQGTPSSLYPLTLGEKRAGCIHS